MNKFTLKSILSVKIPNFPLFGGCNLFFYFRILVIREIDFRDFGNSRNWILDIGFRISTFRILEFEISTFGISIFRILTFGILAFGGWNSGFWTVIILTINYVTYNYLLLFFYVIVWGPTYTYVYLFCALREENTIWNHFGPA